MAGHHGPEVESPLGVGREHPTQVLLGLDSRLLDVVEAVVVGLPDVHAGTGDRLAVRPCHPALDPARRALARSEVLHPEAAEILARDSKEYVLRHLAMNRRTPLHLLDALASSEFWEVRRFVASRSHAGAHRRMLAPPLAPRRRRP